MPGAVPSTDRLAGVEQCVGCREDAPSERRRRTALQEPLADRKCHRPGGTAEELDRHRDFHHRQRRADEAARGHRADRTREREQVTPDAGRRRVATDRDTGRDLPEAPS